MLIEHGADVTAENNDGDTPLHLALRAGEEDVARVIIECGSIQNNDEHPAPYWGGVDFTIHRLFIEQYAPYNDEDVTPENSDDSE